MKPPPFEYAAPESLADVVARLDQAPDDTSLLAGGQSLMPILNMRMAQPQTVVDLNRVRGLDGIDEAADGRIWLGSMVRQRRLETEPVVRERLPLLAEAAGHVAHLPIRTRGTVGGSLAHADPAAELPAAVLALDGRMLVRSARGDRAIAAADFFLGPLTTAIEPGELLVGVEMEPAGPGSGSAFVEVARTHGAFALAAAAAVLRLDAGGGIDHVRLALAGVGGVPYVPGWLADAALGEEPGEALFRRVGERVRAEVEPFDDVHASAAYRKQVAGVLTARALAAAAERANGRGPGA
jgi:aerobic carbon-monoxide dehydrogenase medium subunit